MKLRTCIDTGRTNKAKLNIAFSLLRQIVLLVCGLIVPRLLLGKFGSEAYGATASITTFLAYITLLEGGIGAVSRSTLYKALAEKSTEKVSQIVSETKSFFRKIAYFYIAYVLVLAVFFNDISHNTIFGFWYSFGLVVVISISTFTEYFIGVSYSLLLQADQLDFIQSATRIVVTILNTVAVIVLVKMNCDLLIVKLVSSFVFVLRPIAMSIYAKKKYKLIPSKPGNEVALKQKWTAIGQHIAWTLHNNTDIAVLTIFQSLSLVSVYSVYSMIISKVQDLTSAFSGGMEAVFGNMLANDENEKLQNTFNYYETFLSTIAVTLFSCVSILIISFVKIYTASINDVNYLHPAFAITLASSSLLYNLRTPYSEVIIAAGHFKQTRIAAYGEALVNIITSILLVFKIGLLGVAIGTLAATSFRFLFYVIYLSKNIICRPVSLFLKRFCINLCCYIPLVFLGDLIMNHIQIDGYFVWILVAMCCFMACSFIIFIINYLFYTNEMKAIIGKAFSKIKL